MPTHHLVGSRAGAVIAVTRIDESLDVRTIEGRAHDTHPFAIAPKQLAVLLIEMELLGRERAPLRNDGLAIPPVEIGAFDGAVVQVRNAHVGPVDVPGFHVDRDAIGEPAIGDDDLRSEPSAFTERIRPTLASRKNNRPFVSFADVRFRFES